MKSLIHLGRLGYMELLEKEFGKIMSDKVVVTAERLAHIAENHPSDCELFKKYIRSSLISPDLIIKDSSNKGTVFIVRRLEKTNLNIIVRLVLETDDSTLENSVITFYRIRNSNLEKLKKRHKILYNKE